MFNNRFLRERGVVSTPNMECIPGFSLHFPKELFYGYLSFEGSGKLNWESQLGRTFSLPSQSQRNFPVSFKPKVAIAKFIWKMQKESGIMKSGWDAMPLFLLDDLLKLAQWKKRLRLILSILQNLNFLFMSLCVYFFKNCPSQFLSHWESAKPMFCSEELSFLSYRNQNKSLTLRSV